MWLLTDGCQILHVRDGCEYRLPELPFYRVDGYCVETRTVHEFCGFSTVAKVGHLGIFLHRLVIT